MDLKLPSKVRSDFYRVEKEGSVIKAVEEEALDKTGKVRPGFVQVESVTTKTAYGSARALKAVAAKKGW